MDKSWKHAGDIITLEGWGGITSKGWGSIGGAGEGIDMGVNGH